MFFKIIFTNHSVKAAKCLLHVHIWSNIISLFHISLAFLIVECFYDWLASCGFQTELQIDNQVNLPD